MDLTRYPYPSSRRVVLGSRAVLAASHPLAVAAGAEILYAGGNAVDAALAMAAALTVLEPTANGIGGDLFAIVEDGEGLWGLNASGKSPRGLPAERFLAEGRLPRFGWPAVTVPGVVSGWVALARRWGRLSLTRVFSPAVRYAREGHPVAPEVARAWRRAARAYLGLEGSEFEAFKRVFFPGGRAPRPGEIWRSEDHARTLESIAESEGEAFYRGELAERVAAFARKTGGWIGEADLAEHEPLWVRPLEVAFRGARVYELPPNGQGVVALLALRILETLGLERYPGEREVHLAVEATKRAFAEAFKEVADPEQAPGASERLLDPGRVRRLAAAIGEEAGPWPEPDRLPGGTVYLAAADHELSVSLIQSNYMGFGSGVLVPGTGIALQNRGAGFHLVEDHPNRLAPGKRPYHTIIPGFLALPTGERGAFGLMGGFMQPQGHVQLVLRLVLEGLNPQAALDAPRWQLDFLERALLLEPGFPRALALALADRGHPVRVDPEHGRFGRGQFALKKGPLLLAASEPRADGLALAL